jgi:hypothetical protein
MVLLCVVLLVLQHTPGIDTREQSRSSINNRGRLSLPILVRFQIQDAAVLIKHYAKGPVLVRCSYRVPVDYSDRTGMDTFSYVRSRLRM